MEIKCHAFKDYQRRKVPPWLLHMPTDLKKKKKKDWIEQPIVLAPAKLEPAVPCCWDHFRGKAYYMLWVK